MIVTKNTIAALSHRRWVRAMKRAGFEEVGEGGGRLWELNRGSRYSHRIVGCVISPTGESVWVMVGE